MFRSLIALLFCIPFLCQAQSLTLKNGTKTKVFPADTYFNFALGDLDQDCCYTSLSGNITRLFKDSIEVRVNDIKLDRKKLDFMLSVTQDLNEENLLYKIPKSEVLQIIPYKNKKKSKKTLSTIGGVLLITGVVTLANSYDFDSNDFRGGVLASGGIQVGLGTIFLIVNSKKRYKLTEEWSF